jgi:glycolate oxidase FAD binding subunit
MRSAVIRPAAEGWRLDVALAGSQAGVARSSRELRRLAAAPETGAHRLPEPDSKFLARISVLPSRLPTLTRAIGATSTQIEAFPLLGVCRVWFDDPGAVPSLQGAARALSGMCVIERCPPEVKPQFDVFGDPPPGLTLMRAIKREFDPNNILSPGRMAGKI